MISRTASMPPMSGITMSIVTRSGRSCLYRSTACMPVSASPTTSKPAAEDVADHRPHEDRVVAHEHRWSHRSPTSRRSDPLATGRAPAGRFRQRRRRAPPPRASPPRTPPRGRCRRPRRRVDFLERDAIDRLHVTHGVHAEAEHLPLRLRHDDRARRDGTVHGPKRTARSTTVRIVPRRLTRPRTHSGAPGNRVAARAGMISRTASRSHAQRRPATPNNRNRRSCRSQPSDSIEAKVLQRIGVGNQSAMSDAATSDCRRSSGSFERRSSNSPVTGCLKTSQAGMKEMPPWGKPHEPAAPRRPRRCRRPPPDGRSTRDGPGSGASVRSAAAPAGGRSIRSARARRNRCARRLPAGTIAIRLRSFGSRAIGGSTLSRSTLEVAPDQRRVRRATRRSVIALPSARSVASVFATTISPDVSLSSRWTIPARSCGRRPRPVCCPRPFSALTSVPVQLPGRGVHHHAGGLVDDEQLVVLEYDRERECPRLPRVRSGASGSSDDDLRAVLRAETRFFTASVHEHGARGDQRGGLGTGEVQLAARSGRASRRVSLNREPPGPNHRRHDAVRRRRSRARPRPRARARSPAARRRNSRPCRPR